MTTTTSFSGGERVLTTLELANGALRLTGGNGDNIIEGGSGRDTMIGGDGADTFVFASAGFSRDRILDFDAGEGDLLDFTGLGIDSLSELQAAATITFNADDVMISFGADRVILKDFAVADLADDIFVQDTMMI